MPTPERQRWIEMVKALRQAHQVGIFEAQKLAWLDPHWRRWVERQINNDPKCRKAALRHIRDHGQDSLIRETGGRLVVRSP